MHVTERDTERDAERRRLLIEELEHLELMGGGVGAIIVVDRRSGDGKWLTGMGYEALAKAAASLGFGEGYWRSVIDAIVAGCWPDLVSEAIQIAHNELPHEVTVEIAIGA